MKLLEHFPIAFSKFLVHNISFLVRTSSFFSVRLKTGRNGPLKMYQFFKKQPFVPNELYHGARSSIHVYKMYSVKKILWTCFRATFYLYQHYLKGIHTTTFCTLLFRTDLIKSHRKTRTFL